MNNNIEYVSCKSIVTNSKNDFWFGTSYNMNIYRGCSHGCIYCDSRSECYHDDTFFKVKIKENALRVIERDLRSKQKKGVIATGSMSDPYNPLEKSQNMTRAALKLIDKHGFGVAIATKSPLVTRDIDLLKSIAQHSPVLVMMTVTTADDNLAAKLEPKVALSSARFAALKQLSDNGIFCGILLMPVLPFITDNLDNITAIVNLASGNKIDFVYPAFGVTLRDRQRTYYYNKLDELFPGTKDRYRRTYATQYSCECQDARQLAQNTAALCKEKGILRNMRDIITAYQKSYQVEQLSLF